MNLPLLSVVSSDIALFPMMVTRAPFSGWRDSLSVTEPDMVKFFAWAPHSSESATETRNAMLINCFIVFAVAELGCLPEVRR